MEKYISGLLYIARQKVVSQVSSFQVVEQQSRDTKLTEKVGIPIGPGRTWTCQNAVV